MSFWDSHRSYDWLAQEMVRRGAGRTAFCGWASLLWYDETPRPSPVSSLPASWN